MFCFFYTKTRKWAKLSICWFIKLGLLCSFIQCFIQKDLYAYILPQIAPYNTATTDDLETYLQYSYFYSYTRISVYFLGALFGILYFEYKEEMSRLDSSAIGNSILASWAQALKNSTVRYFTYFISVLILAFFLWLNYEEA